MLVRRRGVRRGREGGEVEGEKGEGGEGERGEGGGRRNYGGEEGDEY